MKNYLITYSAFETKTIQAKSLHAAEVTAHKKAAKLFRSVKSVIEL